MSGKGVLWGGRDRQFLFLFLFLHCATDGVYGIRFAHNPDATVTGLTVVR